MSKENWFIIGISGATCSGKSTVAKELQSLLPGSVLLQQDDYFYEEKSEKHTKIQELNHINFEILSSIDMAAFKNQIKRILEMQNVPHNKPMENSFKENSHFSKVQQRYQSVIGKLEKVQCFPRILILDGFLIFNDDHLRDMCDLKFYFTLKKSVCWERRRVRKYEPPDVPGYFEKYVWPYYLMHYEEVLRKGTNVIYLDGANTFEKNFQCVLERLLNFLQ